MDIRPYTAADLTDVLRLCELEGWEWLQAEPAKAHRALTAPGVTTMIAVEADDVVGFAQLQSDGEIQAHLSLIAVDPAHRRKGIARELIVQALRAAGGVRVDLAADPGAEGFYRALPHFRRQGFRLYPEYSGPDQYRPEIVWRSGKATIGAQQPDGSA